MYPRTLPGLDPTTDPAHVMLLKGIAANTSDRTCVLAYPDYLQEIGNPSRLLVVSYKM